VHVDVEQLDRQALGQSDRLRVIGVNVVLKI